jgi:hypothetical protein
LRAADEQDSDQVSKLLSAAKTQALELKYDIDTMDFFTGSDFDWGSHTAIVNVNRDHIDGIRRQAAKLKDVRSAGSSWQKTTVDRIRPLLEELAAEAETLINRINQNPKRLNDGEYKEYVKVNTDLAAELAALVGNFVDYGRTRQQLEDLAKELDLPSAVSE